MYLVALQVEKYRLMQKLQSCKCHRVDSRKMSSMRPEGWETTRIRIFFSSNYRQCRQNAEHTERLDVHNDLLLHCIQVWFSLVYYVGVTVFAYSMIRVGEAVIEVT